MLSQLNSKANQQAKAKATAKSEMREGGGSAYEAVLVGDVVGELELVERDDLLHPLLAGAASRVMLMQVASELCSALLMSFE